MPNARFYSSIAAVTNLQVTANPGDTNIQVASSTGWPGSFPYIVSLDYGSANEELVLVTSGGPSTFTVTRAYDGTSASTHNAGAVVRHTSSAIDFTDSRTHEASSTGVHGISGAFVDTTSVQTLTNKTLTAPTINNPTIGGTASGGTYTGATLTSPAINGGTLTGVTINGAAITGTITGASAFSGAVTFNSTVTLNGVTNLVGALASDVKQNFSVTGDTVNRRVDKADGSIAWGPGGVSALDTTLARTGVGFLSVTGSLTTSGSVTATGNLLGADISLTTTNWTTYTPTITGTGGASTAVNVGWYKKIGKIVFFESYTQWNGNGSGTTQLSVMLPSTPFREGNGPATTRQIAATGWVSALNILSPGMVMGQVAAGGSSTNCVLSMYDNTPFQGQYITSSGGGTILTFQGWYREA